MATPADLIAEMDLVHAALVERYAWFIHASPENFIGDIRKDGLLPNIETAIPKYVLDAGLTQRHICLCPLGARRCPRPSANTLTIPLGAPDPAFVYYAIIAEHLPRKVGIDLSYARAEIERFMRDNPHLSVGDAAVKIAHEYGSVVSYTTIPHENLRVFCHGDPPTDPLGWKMLDSVSDCKIARNK